MKPLTGYEQAAEYTQTEKLPAGGYIIRIHDAKEETTANARYMLLVYDIAEGEYAGYYKKRYDATPNENRKWKGTHRLYLPMGIDKERDGRNLSRFKTAIKCIERSNNGFLWAWDERTLRNKIVGAVMCEKEYDIDGKRGFYTDLYRIVDADAIRSGNFTVPAPIELKDRTQENRGPFPAAPQDSQDDFPERWKKSPAQAAPNVYEPEQVDLSAQDEDLPF